ncbi:MAG: carbon-nitrogen hydrolase family protein [Candidatus Melainabacteria bacterium]|nr:carbon-nitrogen hydrolase family protein [Candidatus Melainabacteria bacterium]
MTKLKIAAIQMTSGQDKEKNLEQAKKLIVSAAKKKVNFIVLPEVFNFRGDLKEATLQAEKIPGYSTNFISSLAKKYKKWVLVGSLMESVGAGRDLPFNTSVLINPQGKIVAKYRKIHLFDIKLGRKEILESKRNLAGEKPTLVKIGNMKIGMSICYDLRFPELYRYYSNKGVHILCIPSSFTKPTGEAHWHTLVKARAIENLSYVIAPNQAGVGSSGIKTYGHSLIVDPWGKVLAEGPANGEAVIFADIDLNYFKKIRNNLPALEHRKM